MSSPIPPEEIMQMRVELIAREIAARRLALVTTALGRRRRSADRMAVAATPRHRRPQARCDTGKSNPGERRLGLGAAATIEDDI